jgi:YidC/Oxa1 family membrane protein insertase
LRALQFFYSLIPNYGIAIILLTLAVRTLTFPLQFKSFKSMKKMQVVQPELQKLKEKYKDDPQRMQRETMELFKREGANPLGGCFPLLLQMPIFFAFYKVLYAAVELVGAPFFGWITDLSVKDPYYVLPVLMALSMFAQQKLTPSASADQTQQKVMMFMPLIFGVIMKDLPAGLNLYIFVSTIFGVLQQLTVYKMIKD